MAEAAEARETRNITVGTHVIALKTYLNGREVNGLKRDVYSKFKYTTDESGRTKPVMDTNAGYILDQELAAMALCIVTLDGSSENITDRLQDDLRAEEYNEVKDAVNELTKDLFTQARPGSSTGSATTTSAT